MCFGVKSYLHEFYEQNINSTNELDSLIRKRYPLTNDNLLLFCWFVVYVDNHVFYLRKKFKRIRLLWEFLLWIGLLSVLTASALLIYGFMNHEKVAVVIDAEENMNEYVNLSATDYNYYLEWCRLIGLILFTFGGILLALSLILPSFLCYEQCIFKTDLSDEAPINVIKFFNPKENQQNFIQPVCYFK